MIWWIAATLCAFFVKGLCGFANTLVFTTIMSFGLSNRNISPVELLLGYPSNAIIAFRERRAIDKRLCLSLSALVVLGSIPGMLLLKNADTGAIKLLFGAVIILVGVEMLLRELRPRKLKESRVVLTAVGLLSGLLCGLYGVGALLGAYIGRVAKLLIGHGRIGFLQCFNCAESRLKLPNLPFAVCAEKLFEKSHRKCA